MNFPHLSDTQFPNLSTVNVYQYQNNFDYTRWSEKTRIKLCNVPWNSEYADVVKFDTDEERDAWFDSIDDYWAVELETATCVVPNAYVKLPIPYDVMARYNYMFLDVPIITSPNAPLQYEHEDGVRRWYFFIQDIEYLSPSGTKVNVIPDIWTIFQNSVEIPYLLLERGHAPVAFSDTDEYLSNPIANNEYLLAPDVNFDKATINRESKMIPFGTGEKYVCVASTCKPSQIADLGTVTASSAYNPTGTITYSDVDARYGHQLQVNGLTLGNGRDYSNARTPASVGASNDNRIANNLSVYAIKATECYGNGTFFVDVIQQCPQFLTTVKGCFVVSDEALTLGTSYTIAGHTVYACVGRESLLSQSISLEKSDFAFPERYQRFAKLYTSPYSVLEFTDNDGNSYEVGVEETSTLQARAYVSLAFPYINERIYLLGIRGEGTVPTYKWRDLANVQHDVSISNSDWFRFCFDWEIPTFALYMDGETAFMLETFNRNVKQAIQQSIVSYHNTMRSANTAYENACDQADVAYANTESAALTARTNAYNSADTGKTNADNSADTMKANADYLADIAYNNVDRSCTTESTNLGLTTTGTYQNEEAGIAASDEVTRLSTVQNEIVADWANWVAQNTTDVNAQKSTSASMVTGMGDIVGGAVAGATSGAMFGGGAGTVALPGIGTVTGSAAGAILGGMAGAAGGFVSATFGQVQAGITNWTDQLVTDRQKTANTQSAALATRTATNIQGEKDSVRRSTYVNNNTIATNVQNNANTTSRANASDNRTGTKTAATNIQTTQKTNATNTKDTSRTNAANTYTVTEANADRTRDNVQELSGYTRQVAELNAKEILENGKYAAMAAVLDSRNSAPVEVCPYGGDPAPDYYRTRGIQIKVKTQSDSAIRQTGDMFARFGYALNQIWDVKTTGLKLMNHFTYWKATEIWVNDGAKSNNSVNTFIRNMFLNGVTVWNSPEEIGNVDVYSN